MVNWGKILASIGGLTEEEEKQIQVNIKKLASKEFANMDFNKIKNDLLEYAKKLDSLYRASEANNELLVAITYYLSNENPELWKKSQDYVINRKKQRWSTNG